MAAHAAAAVDLLADRDLQESGGPDRVAHHHAARRRRSFSPAAATRSTRSRSSSRTRSRCRASRCPARCARSAALTRDARGIGQRRRHLRRLRSALKNEYVVMSAHLDHVGIGRAVNGDTIYNGAMDDASGVASMIEIARMLKAVRREDRSGRSCSWPQTGRGERAARVALLRGASDRAGRQDRRRHQPRHVPAAVSIEGDRGAGARRSRRSASRYARPRRSSASKSRPIASRSRTASSAAISTASSARGVPALAFKFGYEFGSPDEKTRPATGCATSIISRPTI